MKLYVEGGGDAASLKAACREGFSKFISRAGMKGNMPRIVACGSRGDALRSFCIAVRSGEAAILLVDSEAPVAAGAQSKDQATEWLPWYHLQQRDGDQWQKPLGTDDLQCHLMVQCMEHWFLADRQMLKEYFGQGFKENLLPNAANPIESISKEAIFSALAAATRDCRTKGVYGKGKHSFDLLGRLDPQKVIAISPWASRFIDALNKPL